MFRILDHLPKLFLGASLALAMIVPLDSADAQSGRELYSFQGPPSDGATPESDLIKDVAGNFYGTTYAGGIGDCKRAGCGTVFKLSPDGTETVLYAFCGQANCVDGSSPFGGLIADGTGNLYGTTVTGGGSANCTSGCGTVFKLAPDGTLAVLRAFQGGNDGALPEATLIADAAGDLYGTTLEGGGGCGSAGCGTVFKIAPDGTETLLYAFHGGTDGGNPSGVIADRAGNLYGTTPGGGPRGHGTVFELSPDGVKTMLYGFEPVNGYEPRGGLIRDKAGNLYGTTLVGGDGVQGHGTVFKLARDGTETVLHAFRDTPPDGWFPSGSLIADKSGNLYGTTQYGGSAACPKPGCGTVFKIAPDGTETVLHSFGHIRSGEGYSPVAGLLFDKNDKVLVGTTQFGGNITSSCRTGCGTIFKVKD